MTRQLWRNSFSVLAALLVSLAPGEAASAAGPTTQAAAQAQLNRVVEELNDLSTWFDDADKRLVDWQSEIRRADAEIASTGRSIRDLARDLKDNQAQLQQLRREKAKLEQNSAEQAELVAKHLRGAYRLTGRDFMRTVLSQEDPTTFDRLMRYHEYFTDARVATLKRYRATLAAIAANTRAQAERQTRLNEQRTQLAAQQDALLKGRAERATLIARLEEEMDTNDSRRQVLRRDHDRLDKLLAEIKQSVTKITQSAFARNKGKLPWPLEGRLKHRYRQLRDGGRMRWQGIFVEAPPGTPVHAVASGRVVFAEWLRGWGFLTIVDHGDDNMTLYGFADSLTKAVGDWVEGGEPVASAGGSGGQRTDGLYFEVRAKGKPANPVQWLAPR